MKTRTVSVTVFKARCLAMLDEIASEGGQLTLTKRGRPLATVRPIARTRRKSAEGLWKGQIPAEILDNAEMSLEWEVSRGSGK